MRVLGIDPGTRHLGWGLVERQNGRLEALAHGVISPKPVLTLAQRLVVIERELVAIIETHKPDVASVETLFFHKDPQAAAKLGHARGVVLLTLARAEVELFEYAPAKVKRVIAGGGAADKRQVALMMQALLHLGEVLPSADATDALALAVTHLRLGSLAKVTGATALGALSPRERLLSLVKVARERGKR